MAFLRIVTTRAPGLIPSLTEETLRAARPVILVPESFTLACETEIVKRRAEGGIFDLKIFSPSSLIREVREMTGRGTCRPLSGDGQNMILSQVLHHHRDELAYYRDSVAQPSLAARIAAQIDELTRARLTPEFLREYSPGSRRTRAKLADLALLWDGYRQILAKGFEDTVGQWNAAVSLIGKSGILRKKTLLIYGFDYITHDLLSLVIRAMLFPEEVGADGVVIGLISDDTGADRAIFRGASDSVKALKFTLQRMRLPFTVAPYEGSMPMDEGIAYVEKNLYALGAFAGRRGDGAFVIREDPGTLAKAAAAELDRTEIPDLRHVHLYYARNSALECQHACQTLIDWHTRDGVPWDEMAVAVCEQNTLPSLLPLTLSAAGIPFNAKQDRPILMSGYAQYFLSLLRILRLHFAQEDVLRLIKTGFTDLAPGEAMDMENYARENGIHRGRWLKPFHLPEAESQKARAERLEALRKGLVEPIAELKGKLSRKGCTGKEAATLLFDFITDAGIYGRLQEQEKQLAAEGDDLGIDRNRQVWTAVNELLDTVATFIGDEPLPLRDLCAMLEASLASRKIKSLPQLSGAVMVAPPQMFFSSGVRRMIVMGLQENEPAGGGGVLSEQERSQLEAYIEEDNRKYYEELYVLGGPGGLFREPRPFSRIGQSLQDLAARQKQDVYQAVSLAREELMLSCSSAKPSGGIMRPSTAFRRLERALQKVKPENVNGGLMDPDLRPFAPAFALEALAVRLREDRDSRDSFLRGDRAEDALWRDALSALYYAEAWKKKVESVLQGLNAAAPSGRITPEQADRLYITHGMTISRVETFSSCPYRHFLEYGLVLETTGSYAFRRDEAGTFNHDVVKLFLDEAMKRKEWPDLAEETVTEILNRVLKERVKQWEGGILTSDTMHRYQGAGIIRGVRTSVASMMRAFRQKPHFLPMAAEVPFGMPDETGQTRIPAIRIRTEDGGTVAFSGRIDRIDVLKTEDGQQYFLIVDHKSSAREVRQNSILAGLQLQLPLYIRAARAGLKDHEAAGGLYQLIREVLVASEDPEEIRNAIDKELQTTGIILDREVVQNAAMPLKLSRRLDTNDTVSAASAEEIFRTEEDAMAAVAERVNRIRSGEVAPRPVQDGQESPCGWCDHRSACPFDSTLPGCRIPEIDHRSRRQ